MKNKILLYAIVCLALFSIPTFANPVENNWYKAEDLRDNGSLALNLTAGATTAYAAGKLNNAFLYDNLISSPPNRTTTATDDFGTGEFSVSMWFYSSLWRSV
jgi:uncharacterized PurR-regulated membrane protein YhhQ (DUF165 family)